MSQAETQPCNIEAEQALLAAILVDNAGYENVAGFLKPDHFFDGLHARIYNAISAQISAGEEAKPATLRQWLEADPELQARGGPRYLRDLAFNAVTTINTRSYGRTILDLASRRTLLAAMQEAATMLRNPEPGETADVVARILANTADEIGRTSADRGVTLSARESATAAIALAKEAKERRENGVSVALATGLSKVDDIIGGLWPGDLIVVAGATSMGKSGLALGIARHVAGMRQGAVVIQSMEMSSTQYTQRLLSSESGVAVWRIRDGVLHPDEMDRIEEAASVVSDLPLFINDSSCGLPDLRAHCREIERAHGLGLVVVDYVQLMLSDGRSREEEVARITRGLKQMAKEFGCPILALSQLSRKVDSRDSKRPQLGDLRESGAIEQDADVVLFCFRQAYYEERDNKPSQGPGETMSSFQMRLGAWQADVRSMDDQAEVIIAKQRQGPAPRTVNVRFEAETAQFVNSKGA